MLHEKKQNFNKQRENRIFVQIEMYNFVTQKMLSFEGIASLHSTSNHAVDILVETFW